MGRHYKVPPALILVSVDVITPRPANAFPNMLAANVTKNIKMNTPFCSFGSFLIISLITFTNNPDSSSDLIFSLYLPFLNLKLLMLLCLIHQFSFE